MSEYLYTPPFSEKNLLVQDTPILLSKASGDPLVCDFNDDTFIFSVCRQTPLRLEFSVAEESGWLWCSEQKERLRRGGNVDVAPVGLWLSPRRGWGSLPGHGPPGLTALPPSLLRFLRG